MCGWAAAISTIAGGAFQLLNSRNRMAQANNQAAVYEWQAANTRATMANRAEERRRQADEFASSQRAAFGASGITLEGTPTEVVAQSAGEFARENYYEQLAMSQQAAGQEASASLARSSGRAAATGSLLNFGVQTAMKGFDLGGS